MYFKIVNLNLLRPQTPTYKKGKYNVSYDGRKGELDP